LGSLGKEIADPGLAIDHRGEETDDRGLGIADAEPELSDPRAGIGCPGRELADSGPGIDDPSARMGDPRSWIELRGFGRRRGPPVVSTERTKFGPVALLFFRKDPSSGPLLS
jgi:hypothetical protein